MIPTGFHDDWPFPFSLIPRKANAIPSDVPPAEVYTSTDFDWQHHNPDVPNEGAWALSKHPEYGFSFAIVQNGVLYAIGTFRYDYAGHYYTFPRLAMHKV